MGRPMSRNLLKAGHELTVYDIVPAAVAEMRAPARRRQGRAGKPRRRADIVITMLPDGPEVETAVLGKDGVLEGARPGRSWWI